MSDVSSSTPFAFEPPNFPEKDEDLDEELDLEEDDEEEEDEEEAADAANRVSGGTARAVLEHVARSLVDEPDAVVIDSAESRGTTRYSLHVAPGDMGRVIGRRGRVAQAIRTLVRAAATRDGGDATVDIAD